MATKTQLSYHPKGFEPLPLKASLSVRSRVPGLFLSSVVLRQAASCIRTHLVVLESNVAPNMRLMSVSLARCGL